MQLNFLKQAKFLITLSGVGFFLCSSYAENYPEPEYSEPASKPDLSGFAPFSPSVTAADPVTGAPAISEWTRQNDRGDTMVMTGERLSVHSGADEGQDSRFVFFGQSVSASVLADGIIGEQDGRHAAIKLPSALPQNAMYLMWPKNENGYGKAVCVNKTEAWWVGPDEISAGEPFSIYGRNLTLGGGDCYGYIEGHGWITKAVGGNPYKADFVVPPSLKNGTYTIYVHNGHGRKYGWSDALTFTVKDKVVWNDNPSTWINVKNYGAVGDNAADDYQAIVDAINACPSYGTVYFPAGTYAIGNRITANPSRIRLLGEGPTQSSLTAHSSYAAQDGYGLFHWNPDDAEINGLGFLNGAYYGGLFVRGSATDTVYKNCLFSDYGSPAQGNNVSMIGNQNVTFNDCTFITFSGVYFGGSDGLYFNNCEFRGRGDDHNTYLVAISGSKHVSILGSSGQPNDVSDYTQSEGWSQGRFVLMDGTFGTTRNFYFGDNNTYDMAPRWNWDNDPYDNQPHLNAGEQVLAEHQRVRWRGAVSSATDNTVTCPGVDNVSSGWMMTVIDGKGFGQSRLISNIDFGTGKITVSNPWMVIPDSSSIVSIGTFNHRLVVHQNTFRGVPHVALPINLSNETAPYEPGSFPRETASTSVSFYGGCSDSVVADNTMINLGSAICNYTGLNKIGDKFVAEPNYFNLFLDNTINGCQQVFINNVFADEDSGSTTQPDVGIFASVWRGNTYTNNSSNVINEYSEYNEIKVEQSIYDGNILGDTVEPPPPDGPPPPVLSSIAISGPVSVDEETSAQYVCTATYSDGSTATVSADWSEGSAHASINANGLLSAGNITSDENVIITAGFGGKSDTHVITIKYVAPALTSLTISGPTSMNEETAAQYSCTANYSDGTSASVSPTWSENSSYTSISSTGLLSAGNVTSDQSVNVSASYGGVTGTHTVSIKYVAPTLSSITISGPSNVNEGSTAQYVCTASWSDGTSTTVSPTWSENSSFATINAGGLLTAGNVTSDQGVTITSSFGGQTDTFAVTIKYVAPVMTGITISGPTSVSEETTAQYSCTANYSDGSSAIVTPTWSENASFTTINTSGVLSAGNVTSDQSVTITASYGGKSDTHTVAITYVAPLLNSIAITGPTGVDEETTAQYSCTASWSDGTSTIVSPTWSENSSFATINAIGILNAGNVPDDRNVTITASYGGKSDTHAVTILYVTPPVVVTGISITGPTELDENSGGSFSCTASYSDGTTLPVNPSWSEDAGYASIDASGALSVGNIDADSSLSVTASYQGFTDTQVMTVRVVGTRIVYPLSGFSGKLVRAQLWDDVTENLISLGEMNSPDELVITDINANQWYWIVVEEYDELAAEWVHVHGNWINM